MYRSLDLLSVRGQADLRDPERVRRVFKHYYRGYFAAAGAFAGFGLTAAGLAFLSLGPARHAIPPDWTWLGLVILVAACLFGGAALMVREIARSPLRRYRDRPQDFDFAPAKIGTPTLVAGESRAQNRIRVKGTFEGGGLFFADFEAREWTRRVRRSDLPMDAYAIFERGKPPAGELAGIPAAVLQKLIPRD